jgi:hypothetical protein
VFLTMLWWALLLQSAVAANPAERAEVQACIAASTRGQELRDSGQLIGARAEFRRCAAEACPKAIRSDCAQWAVDAEKLVPSVVLVVREGGADRSDIGLLVDGAEVVRDGRPLELDPGAHRIVARSGAVVQEQTLMVSASEKSRLVVITWAPPAAVVALPPPVVAPTPVLTPVVRTRSFTGPVTLGAVGVLGVAAFVGLGVWGKSELATARASPCAATLTCAPSLTDGVRFKYVAADLGLSVGLTMLAAGALWYFLSGAPPSTAALSAGASHSLSAGWWTF